MEDPASHPPYAPPPPTTNTFAIVALVCGLVFAPLGIVFGHLALNRIKQTGEGGRGLALAGLILGYVSVAVAIVSVVVVVVFLGAVTHSITAGVDESATAGRTTTAQASPVPSVTTPTTATRRPSNPPSTPAAAAIPGADELGFADGSGPRCAGTDEARFIGVSANYKVVKCRSVDVARSYLLVQQSGGSIITYDRADGLSEIIVNSGTTTVFVSKYDGYKEVDSGTVVAEEPWVQHWEA
jgi:uncharacterized membrane protein